VRRDASAYLSGSDHGLTQCVRPEHTAGHIRIVDRERQFGFALVPAEYRQPLQVTPASARRRATLATALG
jgi:hypothetical protein